jgi:hypothetical protein
MVGLIKTGEAGSDMIVLAVVGRPLERLGGWMDSPFMFFGRRGAGEVMGLPVGARVDCSGNVRPPTARLPKDVAGKEESGTRLTGESGEDEGDGSERGDESVVESVVVGEDSADSEACVEVLSWCLWCMGSEGMVAARRRGAAACLPASISRYFGSRTVTVSLSAMVSASRSNTVMKDGIWSS